MKFERLLIIIGVCTIVFVCGILVAEFYNSKSINKNNNIAYNLEKYGENSKYIKITIDIVKDVEENNIEE